MRSFTCCTDGGRWFRSCINSALYLNISCISADLCILVECEWFSDDYSSCTCVCSYLMTTDGRTSGVDMVFCIISSWPFSDVSGFSYCCNKIGCYTGYDTWIASYFFICSYFVNYISSSLWIFLYERCIVCCRISLLSDLCNLYWSLWVDASSMPSSSRNA